MADRVPCKLPAVFRYTWPGNEERHACVDHANQVVGLAGSMGFRLQVLVIANNKLPIIMCSHSDVEKEDSDGK
jgi:hypothetical protein